jgi:RimJ/RimL family protein N-acetyltransferase
MAIVAGEEVVNWVYAATGGGVCRNSAGIGDQRGERLVAGVVLENWNGSNVMLHIRADKPPVRGFWTALFDYIFERMHSLRATAAIDETNDKCIQLVIRLGFQLETVMNKAGRDGVDVLIFVLWARNRRHFTKRQTS